MVINENKICEDSSTFVDFTYAFSDKYVTNI